MQLLLLSSLVISVILLVATHATAMVLSYFTSPTHGHLPRIPRQEQDPAIAIAIGRSNADSQGLANELDRFDIIFDTELGDYLSCLENGSNGECLIFTGMQAHVADSVIEEYLMSIQGAVNVYRRNLVRYQ